VRLHQDLVVSAGGDDVQSHPQGVRPKATAVGPRRKRLLIPTRLDAFRRWRIAATFLGLPAPVLAWLAGYDLRSGKARAQIIASGWPSPRSSIGITPIWPPSRSKMPRVTAWIKKLQAEKAHGVLVMLSTSIGWPSGGGKLPRNRDTADRVAPRHGLMPFLAARVTGAGDLRAVHGLDWSAGRRRASCGHDRAIGRSRNTAIAGIPLRQRVHETVENERLGTRFGAVPRGITFILAFDHNCRPPR